MHQGGGVVVGDHHTAVTRNASAPEQSTSAFSSSAGLSLHASPIHIDTSPQASGVSHGYLLSAQ